MSQSKLDVVNFYKDAEFESLDIDMDEEKTSQYGDLDILPVVIISENEKEIGRIIGEHSKEEMLQRIKEVVKNEEK